MALRVDPLTMPKLALPGSAGHSSLVRLSALRHRPGRPAGGRRCFLQRLDHLDGGAQNPLEYAGQGIVLLSGDQLRTASHQM